MRRTGIATVVAVLVMLMVLGPAAPASAAQPPPGPVTPIPDLPSNTVRMVQSGGTWTVPDIWKAAWWRAGQLGSGTVATIPKPITPPAAITRGAAGSNPWSGTALVGFTAGWAIGQGGLALYALATNSNYAQMVCQQPSWYQGANDFLTMGVAPDCVTATLAQNPDITPGQTANLGGDVFRRSAAYPLTICGPTVQRSDGHTYRAVTSNGNVGLAWNTSTAWRTSICPPSNSYGGSTATGSTWTAVQRLNGATVVETATVVTQTANPTRTPSCTITWTDGSSTFGTGTTYGELGGLPMSAPGFGCTGAWDAKPGAGIDTFPDRIKVDSDDGTGAKTTISDQDVPPFTETQRKPFTGAGATPGAGLVLSKVVGTSLSSCNTWQTDCSGWWEATDDATTPGPYRCTFDGDPVDLIECGPYRHTFDEQTTTPTITDPSTGEEVSWSAQPTTGNSLNPGTGPGTGANPAAECFATGWADVLNPIDWVLVPVKCALVWAFVPRTSAVTTATTTLTTSWEASALGAWSNALTSLAFVSPGAGCGGIVIPLGDIWGHGIQNFSVLQACPGDTLHPLAVACSLVIGVMAIIGLIWVASGSLGGIVGFRGLSGGGS